MIENTFFKSKFHCISKIEILHLKRYHKPLYMKKIFQVTFLCCMAAGMLRAQTHKTIFLTEQNYQQLKQAGKLQKDTYYSVLNPNQSHTEIDAAHAPSQAVIDASPSQVAARTTTTSSSCQCMVPLDPTFSVVPFNSGTAPYYRNDDGYTTAINLGFNFCFYGTTYNQCYINNNGNITFVNGLFSFSAGGFPAGSPTSLDTIMIAPFWADVDTRDPGSGVVYYKQTANYLIVKWDSVGYYSSHSDKVNTFQLIISNGTDPILPSGNVAFCYGDMQWTTGDVSPPGNVGGFGGIPATVGVNKGDHNNYIQIGRFNLNSSVYDGPYGNNDGVNFLDYKSFFFNTCGTNNNLPPIIQDASGGASVCGDTISICALGDTLGYTTSFLAPESNQTVTITGSAPGLGSHFVPLGVTSTAGGLTTYAWMVTTTGVAPGIYPVTVTGTDNGTPNLSTTATYYIKIMNIPVPQPTITVVPSGSVCATPGATLSVSNCASYDEVFWSNGVSGCSIVATAGGQYFVSVKKLGCYKGATDSVRVYPNPNPTISGPLNYCNGLGTTISVNTPTSGAAYSTYTWTPLGTVHTYSDNVTAGNYTVSVTDTHGCTGSTTFTVSSAQPTVAITANPPYICGAGTVTLTASISGASYTWSPGGQSTQTIVTNTTGTYSVAVSSSGCNTNASITVSISPTPTVTLQNIGICQGNPATLTPTINPSGSYTYTWSNGSNASPLVTSTTGTYSVAVTNTVTGCTGQSNTVTVAAAPNPTVTFNPSVSFCNGSSAALTNTVTGGTAPFTYTWNPSSLSGASPSVNQPGVVSVTVTNASGCVTTNTVLVSKITPSVTIAPGDSMICPGACVQIVANGSSATPVTYSWTPNANTTGNILTACSALVYSVTVTDQQGCTASATKHIYNNVVPEASFTGNPPSPVVPGQTINFANTSSISSGSIASSSWSFGDGVGTAGTYNASYTYPTAGTYPVVLIVTGSNGCKDTAVVNYEVQAVLVIPNIFTPNGDNVNDFFAFKNLNFYPSNHLVIYNRWGNKVFEQDNYKNDWNGQGHSDGTYFFILTVPNGLPKNNYEGYVQLMR